MSKRSTTSIALAIRDAGAIEDARRAASTLVADLALPEAAASRALGVVDQLATRLALHATDGVLFLRAAAEGDGRAIDVLSIDRGPVLEMEERLREEVRRRSLAFDLVSEPGVGTIVFARIGETPKKQAPFEIGAVCTALAGESACGDAWCAVDHANGDVTLLVADGLGHGALAAEAAEAVMGVLSEHRRDGTCALLEAAHTTARRTRGAAVAVARIEADRSRLEFAGVGNVVTRVYDGTKVHSGLSKAGVIGHNAKQVRSAWFPWGDRGVLVMHSDGVASHWQMERYEPLFGRHPALLAGAIWRDHHRGRDDATIVVLRTRTVDTLEVPEMPQDAPR